MKSLLEKALANSRKYYDRNGHPVTKGEFELYKAYIEGKLVGPSSISKVTNMSKQAVSTRMVKVMRWGLEHNRVYFK